MRKFLISTIFASFSICGQAANLVCNGTLMVECSANPYAPNPHGFCGERFLSNVFVQIKELQPSPCGVNCGIVSINGHPLIDGEFTIVFSTTNAISIAKKNEKQKTINGTIHRVTGDIGLVESDPSRNYRGSFGFRGSCSARQKLF